MTAIPLSPTPLDDCPATSATSPRPAPRRGTTRGSGATATPREDDGPPLASAHSEDAALEDDLTPLPSRADVAEYVRASAVPAGGVAVLLLDLDDFRVVNDSLGHASGDLLLTQVARRIGSQLSVGQHAGRLAGDGFVVVLPGGDVSGAVELAEALLVALEAPVHIRGTELTISSSIGIATSQCVGDVDDLLSAAETALHAAKQRGKAGMVVFQPQMLQVAKDRLSLETGLRQAVRNAGLHVVYQPIVDLKTGALSGVEALVRWRDEERGEVSPLDFIPVAERTGLILPLGEWVLREAVSCLQRWNAEAPGRTPTLNVNVSPRQLERHGFLTIVDELLASGLDPAQLVLEITETALTRDDDVVTDTLQALRTRGIRLAVDDFGTGYSSLSRLRSAPVSQVKIDRSFVSEITLFGADVPIVDATAAMAVGLGLGVIAEGIENHQQLHYLRRLGCGHAQGYLLARPVDADGISKMLVGDLPWTGLLANAAPADGRSVSFSPSAPRPGEPASDDDAQLRHHMAELRPAAIVTAAETIAALAAADVAADAAATAQAAVTVACAAALKAATKAEAVAADAAAAAAAAHRLSGASSAPHTGNTPTSPGDLALLPADGSTAHAARDVAVSRTAAAAAAADAAASAAVKVAVRVESVAAAAATATLEAAALIERQLTETVAATATAVARQRLLHSRPDARAGLQNEVEQRDTTAAVELWRRQPGTAPSVVDTRTLVLARSDAPRVARRVVAEHCRAAATGTDCADDAVLLTSEVVSNAMLHGSGAIGLRLESDHRRVRVEVDDDDRQHPRAPAMCDEAEDGRGMFLVDALSTAWGVADTPTGKTVWFELSAQPQVRESDRRGLLG